MSKRDLAEETFGDISRFITYSRNRGIRESLDVSSEEVKFSDLVPCEQQLDTTSSTSTLNEETHPHCETQEETSFSLKPQSQNVDSSDSSNITGHDFLSTVQETYAETIETSSNTAWSENGSKLCSWSGPESCSTSEHFSWGDSKNTSISTGHCSDNRNSLENPTLAQKSSPTPSLEVAGKLHIKEPVESPDQSEDWVLPRMDAIGEHEIKPELSNNSEGIAIANDGYYEMDGDMLQLDNLNFNNDDVIGNNLTKVKNTSEPVKVSDANDMSNGEASQCNNSNPTDGRINNNNVDGNEDNFDEDFSAGDHTLAGLSNPFENELEMNDELDNHIELGLGDKTEAENRGKIHDVSESDKYDEESDGVNLQENSDGGLSPVQSISSKSQDFNDDYLSIILPEDNNSVGSLANNGDIAVHQNDELSLEIREEANDPGWTVLEVWSCFAMAVGAMPYWISNDGKETQIKRNKASTVLWYLSLVMYAVEIVHIIPKTFGVLNWEANMKAFLQLGINISSLFFRLACIRTGSLKINHLVDANNRLLSFPSSKMAKKKAVGLFVMLFSAAILNGWLFIMFQFQLKNDFGEFGLGGILEKFECDGKIVIQCSPSTNLSFVKIMLAIIGFSKATHQIAMETAVSQGVILLCSALLFASYNTEGTESNQPNDLARVTENDLISITKLAEDMSKFIGEVLFAYLIYYAVNTPTELIYIFSGSSIAVLFNLFNHGAIYAGLILGSIASLKIKGIADSLASHDHIAPLQATQRPGTAIIMSLVQEIMFRKSVGVGLPGIFVINFKITFSYLGIVGTILTLILPE